MIQTSELVAIFADARQKSTPLREKLGSAKARLDRLRLRGGDSGLGDENWNEQRAKLFEWVFRINWNITSRSFSTSNLRLIGDTGDMLYNRMSAGDYEESQDDIQAVSGIVEDIHDVLFDYQVCSDRWYAMGCN